MNAFGDFIRNKRERASLSLGQAAKLAKISKAHLWQLERAESRNPSIVTLAGLASLYGTDIGRLARLAAGCVLSSPSSKKEGKG